MDPSRISYCTSYNHNESSETVNRGITDNTMAKRKQRLKRRTTVKTSTVN